MSNIQNTTPIDPRDPAYDKLLAQLQGNILKGHGRERTMNIFVRFDTNRKKQATTWVREFADTLTSMKTQLRETEVFKRNKIPGGLFAGLYLTARGYQYFDLPIDKFETVFQEGMQKQALHDPKIETWDKGLRGTTLAMRFTP